MTFQHIETILKDLRALLTLENTLLKDYKARDALQYMDQKNHLMSGLMQATQLLKQNTPNVPQNAQETKAQLQQQVLEVHHLAQENESMLKKISLVNQRVLDRIIGKVRKITAPVNCYTARGKNDYQGQAAHFTTAPLSLSHQV